MTETQRDDLARLLLESWDPVGVRDTDTEPEREYVFEADAILALLQDDATEDVVAARLRVIGAELGNLDLPLTSRVAARIMSWYLRPAAAPRSAEEAGEFAVTFMRSAWRPRWEPAVVRVEDAEDSWRVFYNSRAYVDTGDASHALAGNWPLLVSKRDGEVVRDTKYRAELTAE